MKSKISFIACAMLLAALGFGTASQAQYERNGEYKQNRGRNDRQDSQGINFVALTNNNGLVLHRNNAGRLATVNVTGTNENLLSIDYRPANGMLYGITSTKAYTINPKTGAATEVSTFSLDRQPFTLGVGQESGIDFNPVVDRLRVVGSNDENFRINIDTGAVTVDRNINYGVGDPNAGKNPALTAAAYTNSFAGGADPTRTTVLYGIETSRNVLTIQNPPNDGTLQTVGSLKVRFDRVGGFNISANNKALAISNSTIYEIDLTSGGAKPIAKLPNAKYIGLAVPIESK
jgi:hypothetical protein